MYHYYEHVFRYCRSSTGSFVTVVVQSEFPEVDDPEQPVGFALASFTVTPVSWGEV